MSRKSALPLVAALVLGLARSVLADSIAPDSFRCHKTKDPSPSASYTADLVSVHPSFPNETGCLVKVPAKLLCSPVAPAIAGGPPFPPGTSQGGATPTEHLACYKLKCPRSEFGVPVGDAFGSRTVTVKSPRMLCAPADFE
jgi:hypothetical protein